MEIGKEKKKLLSFNSEIKENRRKVRWRDTNMHAKEIRRKMNKKGDINNKKA